MAKKYFFALFLFALVGLRQPLPAAATGAGKSSNQTDSKSSPQKTPSDPQIEQAIRVKLAKSKMNADHFTISVAKGVVTIEGSTAVMQHKGAMTRMVKSCGATSVRNNIRVSEEAKEKLAQSLTKARAASGASGATTGTKPGTSGDAQAANSSPASIPRATVLRPKQ